MFPQKGHHIWQLFFHKDAVHNAIDDVLKTVCFEVISLLDESLICIEDVICCAKVL